MASLIIKNRSVCSHDGSFVTDANGAPCVCDGGGGGGGGDCCVCGKCYFDGGPAPVHITMDVSGSGSFVECCRPLGPSTGTCAQSDFNDSISHVFDREATTGQCEVLSEHGFDGINSEAIDCDGVPGSFINPLLFDVRSAVVENVSGTDLCPNVVLPQNGAILAAGINNGVDLVVWGGHTRLHGPIVFVRSQFLFGKTLFETLSQVYLYYFSDSDGNSSFIAVHGVGCRSSNVCIDGCAWSPGDNQPIKVAGGGTTTGGFDCGGLFEMSGNYHATYESACQLGGSDCGDGSGFPHQCIDTGTTALNINFSASFSLAALMRQCPPDPKRGTGSGAGSIGTGAVHIPQAFLDSDSVLQQAYDAIRSLFEPGAGGISQTPPPAGGFRPAEDFLP